MGSICSSTVKRGNRGPDTGLLLLASVAPARTVAQTALTPAAIEAMADRHFGKAKEAGGAGALRRPAATWRRALKGAYVVPLGSAALVTIVLLGNWDLIGSFTS